jgi:MFS family permease
LLLITGGRLGDIVGRARIFTLGVAGFVLASLVCALAPSSEALIAARAVQGATAALVIPQTFGLIRAMFSGTELPGALGTIGPVMALSAILGPVLGGFLTHADLLGWSWRSVFLVNVPLGMAVLAASRLLREDRSFVGSRHAAVRALLVQIEPSVLHGRMFPSALATSLLAFAVMSGLTLAVELQLQLVVGTDVLSAGFTLVPLSIGLGAASWVGGSVLVPRFGPKLMHVGASALWVAGIGRGRVGLRWPLPLAAAVGTRAVRRWLRIVHGAVLLDRTGQRAGARDRLGVRHAQCRTGSRDDGRRGASRQLVFRGGLRHCPAGRVLSGRSGVHSRGTDVAARRGSDSTQAAWRADGGCTRRLTVISGEYIY